MGYVFYVFGALGIVVAGLVFVRGTSVDAGPLGPTFALIYGASIFGSSMIFLAIGRGLDLLATIAANSRRSLRYLEYLDPEIADERQQEMARREERSQRGFFGFGTKRVAG